MISKAYGTTSFNPTEVSPVPTPGIGSVCDDGTNEFVRLLIRASLAFRCGVRMEDNRFVHKQRQHWRSHSPRLPPAEREPPPCTKCGHHLAIRQIEPSQPGHDLRTYQCSRCQNFDRYVVRYQTDDPWTLVRESDNA